MDPNININFIAALVLVLQRHQFVKTADYHRRFLRTIDIILRRAIDRFGPAVQHHGARAGAEVALRIFPGGVALRRVY